MVERVEKPMVPRSGLHRGGGKCGRILVQDANAGYCPVWVAEHIIALCGWLYI